MTLLSAATLAVLSILVGCAARNGVEPPSAAAAERLIADAVRLARAADFGALCGLGGGACRDILQAAGRDGVPRERPRIVVNEPVPATGVSGSGVRLVVVCGSRTDGTLYRTEMAVVWDGGRATLLEPVFWSGMSVSGPPANRPVGEPSRAAATCRASGDEGATVLRRRLVTQSHPVAFRLNSRCGSTSDGETHRRSGQQP